MDPISEAIPDLPEDDPSFGPAMRKLTPRQRKFVLAVGIVGRGNFKRCALLAGYKDHTNNTAQIGWRLSHDPLVQAAMLEEAGKRLSSYSVSVADSLLDIAQNAKKESLRLKATLAIADRIGMHAHSEHTVNVTHELGSNATLLARIRESLRKNPENLKLVPEPIQKLLAQEKAPVVENIIDGEFEEVRDPDFAILGE